MGYKIPTTITIIFIFGVLLKLCCAFSEDCSITPSPSWSTNTCQLTGDSVTIGNHSHDLVLQEHLNCPSRPIRESVVADKSHTWSGFLVKTFIIKPLVNMLEVYNKFVNFIFNNQQAYKGSYYGLFAVEYYGIPKDVIQSFYTERMPAYYEPISNYLTTYYIDMLSFNPTERKHYLPSYERLMQMMTSSSPSSEGLIYQDDTHLLFEIPGIKNIASRAFKGFHFSITGAKVDLLQGKITFHSCMENSQCYYYDSHHPKYKFAVADFVNGIVASILYHIHPKSHFHSTDLFAYACLKTRNTSNLNKILCHHSKHTLFLNDDVLRSTRLPLENSESILSKYLYPLASHPWDSKVVPTILSDQLNGKCLGIPCFNRYSKFDMILSGYFEITRKFINEIKGQLEKDELNLLIKIINEENLEICEGLDVYDLLAAFVYKSSFYHSIDHYTAYMMVTYGPLLAQKNIPNTLIQNNIPISVSIFNKKIEDINEMDTLETVNDLRYSYSVESVCLLFMKYHFNKEMPLSNPTMLNLNYSFVDSRVNQLTERYVEDYRHYTNQLGNCGNSLAPLHMISPSISF